MDFYQIVNLTSIVSPLIDMKIGAYGNHVQLQQIGGTGLHDLIKFFKW